MSSAIIASLLTKTVEFLFEKAVDMTVEFGQKKLTQRELEQAEELVTRLASAIIPEEALLVSVRCEPELAHGLRVSDVQFILDVFNVTPVILRIERVEIEALGIWAGEQALKLTDKPCEMQLHELNPGHLVSLDFCARHQVMPGAAFSKGSAVACEVKIKIHLYGPVQSLCKPVHKRLHFWMRCLESIEGQAAT
jgi:hypothetical protein